MLRRFRVNKLYMTGKCKRFLWKPAIILVIFLGFFYIVVPLVTSFSPGILRELIFNHAGIFSSWEDLTQPENLGLLGVRNFYIPTDLEVSVGVWHILPENMLESAPSTSHSNYMSWYENALGDGRPIVLYLHGNKGSRGQEFRLEFYKVLRKLDFHIVALDYRGYGDSSYVEPTEAGVVQDSKSVYHHIRLYAPKSPIIIWGHSLGTGIGTEAVAELCRESQCPTCLVLEAPFNNIREAVRNNPMARLFRWMPLFDWLILDTVTNQGIEFASDRHITHVLIPILFLHAQDDAVVPFGLGEKLFTTAKRFRPTNSSPLEFVAFESHRNLGHNMIYQAVEMPTIAKRFIKEAISLDKERSKST